MIKWLPCIFFLALISCEENVNPSAEPTGYTSVIDSLNLVLEKDPSNESALYSRADYYYDLGESQLALADLNKKMALSQTDADFYLKGNILFSDLQIKNNASNANKAYRLCVQENPNNANCYVKLGQIQQLLGNYNECLQLVDSALRINRQLSDAYFIKGFTFELRKQPGDSALAISSYQTAVEVDPKFYDAYMRLGDLHASEQDSIAIEYYKSAISLQPSRVEAYYNLCIYLQNSERYDLAMDYYDKMIEIDEKSFLAYFNQGYLLLVHAEAYEEASEKFSKAITHNPAYVEAYHNRGLCYKNLGKYEYAKIDFQKALELQPDLRKSAIELSDLDKIKD